MYCFVKTSMVIPLSVSGEISYLVILKCINCSNKFFWKSYTKKGGGARVSMQLKSDCMPKITIKSNDTNANVKRLIRKIPNSLLPLRLKF